MRREGDREHWVSRHKGTKESDAFWEPELVIFSEHRVSMGRTSRQAWECGQVRTMFGHLAKQACLARGT